jgi:hypothetical protein
MKIRVDVSQFQNPSRAARLVEMYRPVFERVVKHLKEEQRWIDLQIKNALTDLTKSLTEYLKAIAKIFHTPEQLHWASAFHRNAILHDLVENILVSRSFSPPVRSWFSDYAESFTQDHAYDPRADEIASHILLILPDGFFVRKPLALTQEEKKEWDREGEARMDLRLAFVLIQFQKEMDPRADLRRAFTDHFEDHRFGYYLAHFAHFFETAKANRIEKILKWNPKGKTVRGAVIELRKIEEEWLKTHEGRVMKKGEPALRLKDGWAWFRIPQTHCEETGAAMGHCGNTPSQKLGDEVWNLGKIAKAGGYKPSVTFILNRGPDGKFPAIVGEMKGRGNKKPHFDYHPQILKLLESEWVGFVFGGGYLASENWSPEDLSDEKIWKEMVRVKPELTSVLAYLKAHGKEAGAWAIHHLLQIKMTAENIRDEKIVIQEWSDISELVRYHFDERRYPKIQYYMKVLGGEEWSDYQGEISDYEIEAIFEAVEKHDQKGRSSGSKSTRTMTLLPRLKAFVLSQIQEFSDGAGAKEALKEERYRFLAREIIREKSELYSFFWRVASRSYETGIEGEMAKQAKDWFEDMAREVVIADLELVNDTLWGAIRMTASFESLAKYIDRERMKEDEYESLNLDAGAAFFLNKDNIQDAGDADWTWDDGAAVDAVLDELHEKSPKQNPVKKERSLSLSS